MSVRGLAAAAVVATGIAASCAAALAVTPGERLADAAQEARAREISREIRCVVCQNQSIDDSDADLAHDLRVLVRERIAAGDTDAQVFAYLTDRYGQFVRLRPAFDAANIALWAAPFVTLAIAGAAAALYLRRRAPAAEAPLGPDEEQALATILARRQAPATIPERRDG